jgi:hypothetical protein
MPDRSLDHLVRYRRRRACAEHSMGPRQDQAALVVTG